MSTLTSALSYNLRRLREGKGWSQEVLAERASISRDVIARAETGDHIRLETIVKIAAAIDCDETELLKDPNYRPIFDYKEAAKVMDELISIINIIPEDCLKMLKSMNWDNEAIRESIESIAKNFPENPRGFVPNKSN